MRKIKKPKLGEYLLFKTHPDRDFNSPFFIGTLESITENEKGFFYTANENERIWRHVYRITPAEGKDILMLYGDTPTKKKNCPNCYYDKDGFNWCTRCDKGDGIHPDNRMNKKD